MTQCQAYATGHLKQKGGEWIRCSRPATRTIDTTTTPSHLCTFHANQLDNGHDIHGHDGTEGFKLSSRKSA